MDASEPTSTERSGEALFVAMAFGIIAMTALISAMALVGEWWILAVTLAALGASAIGIVAMIGQRLDETGDSEPAAAAAPSRPAARVAVAKPSARDAAPVRSLVAH